MSLCARCSSFNIQSFTEAGFPARGYPLLAVIRAAERERCSFCSLLVDQINVLYDLRPYLSYEFHSQAAETLSILGVIKLRMSIIFRRLSLRIFTQWLHFSVERGARERNVDENSLNITAIVAAIQHVPNTQEKERADLELNPHELFWGEDDIKIRLHVAADQGTLALQSGDIAGTLSLDRSTWSASHYQRIQNWHRDCQLKHENCNRSIAGYEEIRPDDAPLPTRCVEFKFLDEQNPWTSSIQWHLRETEGKTGRYLALSHRWAKETKEANTTKENYSYRVDTWDRPQSYHDLLARGKLTALFLDIGRLACHLGIRYVWIDSLCIIQDDIDDWTHEATKMADYYQRSWLTVAVTSPSDTGGIFQQDVSKIPRVTRLPYYDKNGEQSGHFYVQAGTDEAWADDYRETILRSELRKRAWVFQEWRLSRRILALSNQGMFLQCQSQSPMSLDGYTMDTCWQAAEATQASRTRRILDVNSSEFDILNSWAVAVEEYSELLLTKEEDRLVALAGIAREYGRALAHKAGSNGQLQHKYLCGLWTGWVQGLLWEQIDTSSQIRTKGFPTWSWLSIAETNDATDGTFSGLRVQWPSLGSLDIDVCEFESPFLVPLTDDWDPIFEKAGEHELQYLYSYSHSDLRSEHYGNVIHFAILQMIGKMLDVCLYWYFDPEDAEIAATMTAHRKGNRRSELGCSSWRKVCLQSSSNTIIGWASIEHPDYQIDQSFTSANPIYAFVAGKIPKAPGGYGLGHPSGSHTVFKVLFVRRVDIVGRSNCYERIGVGRLFGGSVIEAFEACSKTKIYLV